MGAALSHSDTLDGGLATVAGFAGALVDLKFVLELAAAVNPIDAGAVAFDAQVEHGAETDP